MHSITNKGFAALSRRHPYFDRTAVLLWPRRPPLVYLTNTPLEIPASSRPNNIDARMSRKDGSVQVHRIPRIASPTQARHRAHQSVRFSMKIFHHWSNSSPTHNVCKPLAEKFLADSNKKDLLYREAVFI